MQNHYRVEGPVSLVFFIITFVFLHLILLNLFLAILLQNFSVSEEKQRKDNEQKTFTRLRRTCRRCFRAICCRSRRLVTPNDAVFENDNFFTASQRFKNFNSSLEDSSSLSSDMSRSSKDREDNQSAKATVKFDRSAIERLSVAAALKRNEDSPFASPHDTENEQPGSGCERVNS